VKYCRGYGEQMDRGTEKYYPEYGQCLGQKVMSSMMQFI